MPPIIEELSNPVVGPPRRDLRRRTRLWLVSLMMLVAGYGGAAYAHWYIDDVAMSYPMEVAIQWYFYQAGLFVWLLWVISRPSLTRGVAGCLGGLVLAFATFMALISSIPK